MSDPMRSLLVIGGARSGKSRFAETLATRDGRAVTLIATAQAGDDEMAARIAQHKAMRPPGFSVVEEPLHLVTHLATLPGEGRIIIVDCLTLWLTNILLAGWDVEAEGARLADALAEAKGPIILVSNEVGLGIVPHTALGRSFRDAQGRLNTRIAEVADGVVMMVAGLPLWLKPQSHMQGGVLGDVRLR
jgi:adenosylcobinamide kinase / adenosylcobinamide-phosphate guanylyltransferase